MPGRNEKENTAATSLIQPGQRLPMLRLMDGTGEPIRLDAPELGSPALLMVRAVHRARAQPAIAEWEHRLPDFHAWDGRPILVHEGPHMESALPSALARPEDWDALGIEPANSALIIADRWGVVYAARQAAHFAELPNAEYAEEWLRFLATQCPECGVIDEPGYGEWAP
jgi:hypothetical protein